MTKGQLRTDLDEPDDLARALVPFVGGEPHPVRAPRRPVLEDFPLIDLPGCGADLS